MRILVTGAFGFIGTELCNALTQRGCHVRKGTRAKNARNLEDTFEIGNIGPETNWEPALKDIDAVVHLAARVHVMNEKSTDPSKDFGLVNVLGTEKLANSAVKAGVKRFIFLSTVKVNGEFSRRDSSGFTEQDFPNPQDAYAVSKWETEQLLNRISQKSNLEVVIVRSPLVYGPGVKANYLRLMKYIEMGLPLPFKSVKNLRSYVSLTNLVDFLILCLENQNVAGETFLVSDNEDISTAQLIQKISYQMNRIIRLYPFPIVMLKVCAYLIGKQAAIDRLCGDLQVDISKAKKQMGWIPPYSIDIGIKDTVNWYLGNPGI
jgi:nucleoside-diphosphate-sugar epimerase